MKALLWKEFREAVVWAALFGLVFAVGLVVNLMQQSSSYQGTLSLVSYDMKDWTFCVSLLSGFVLGLLQIVPDRILGLRTFLLHRSASASRVYSAKASVGCALLLTFLGLPLLAAAAWVGASGRYAGPFHPCLLYPGIAGVLCAIPGYFAGHVVGLGSLRSNSMLTGPAIVLGAVCAALEFLPGFLQAVGALLLAGALCAAMAWSRFLSWGGSSRIPAAARVAQAVAAVLCGVVVHMMFLVPAFVLDVWFERDGVDGQGRSVRNRFEMCKVDRSGRVWRVATSWNGMAEYLAWTEESEQVGGGDPAASPGPFMECQYSLSISERMRLEGQRSYLSPDVWRIRHAFVNTVNLPGGGRTEWGFYVRDEGWVYVYTQDWRLQPQSPAVRKGPIVFVGRLGPSGVLSEGETIQRSLHPMPDSWGREQWFSEGGRILFVTGAEGVEEVFRCPEGDSIEYFESGEVAGEGRPGRAALVVTRLGGWLLEPGGARRVIASWKHPARVMGDHSRWSLSVTQPDDGNLHHVFYLLPRRVDRSALKGGSVRQESLCIVGTAALGGALMDTVEVSLSSQHNGWVPRMWCSSVFSSPALVWSARSLGLDVLMARAYWVGDLSRMLTPVQYAFLYSGVGQGGGARWLCTFRSPEPSS